MEKFEFDTNYNMGDELIEAIERIPMEKFQVLKELHSTDLVFEEKGVKLYISREENPVMYIEVNVWGNMVDMGYIIGEGVKEIQDFIYY